jgi:hypothetical protein
MSNSSQPWHEFCKSQLPAGTVTPAWIGINEDTYRQIQRAAANHALEVAATLMHGLDYEKLRDRILELRDNLNWNYLNEEIQMGCDSRQVRPNSSNGSGTTVPGITGLARKAAEMIEDLENQLVVMRLMARVLSKRVPTTQISYQSMAEYEAAQQDLAEYHKLPKEIRG